MGKNSKMKNLIKHLLGIFTIISIKFTPMKNFAIALLSFVPFLLTAQAEGWLLSAKKVPQYTGIVAANGRIGILPDDKPFQTKSIILNNVYDKESPLGVSKILLWMNFANLDIEIDGEQITEQNVS